MSETTHLFTSITANYLPKARVLAHSAKRQGADIRFHVLLCDDYPADTGRAPEPFDSIIDVEELPIPDMESWLFGHTVVEMCRFLHRGINLRPARTRLIIQPRKPACSHPLS